MSYCKSCSNSYHKEHYIRNRAKYIAKHTIYHKKIDAENRVFLVNYLTAHPCVDCGENDIRVLEFDHISEKKHTISHMLADSVRWKLILLEIAKCEVRCANCHKRRTAQQFGWHRHKAHGAIV